MNATGALAWQVAKRRESSGEKSLRARVLANLARFQSLSQAKTVDGEQ